MTTTQTRGTTDWRSVNPFSTERHQIEVSKLRLPARWIPAVVIGLYLLGGFYITARLWADIDRVLAHNEEDHHFFQFAFAHAAHAISSWESPFFSSMLNAPHGVNMMANTSLLALAVPLAPITLIWGAKPAVAMALVIGLSGTAAAWYYFVRRHVTSNQLFACFAGAFCGFAPAMVSHANGHPNITAQFMVPLIISRVIRLREPRATVRHGVILGLMVICQMFLNEEVLMYTVMACAVMACVYACSRAQALRRELWRYVGGLSIAASLALAAMAYPLWFQFFGPQHYTGPFAWAQHYGMDLAAFTGYASESIAGVSGGAELAANPAEENAFFGWPLCVMAFGLGIAFWKVMAVRIAVVVGSFLALLSLGNHVKLFGKDTGIPGPWRLVSDLPLFDAVITTRLAMGVAPTMAIILAVGLERTVRSLAEVRVNRHKPLLVFVACAFAAAFLPVAPTPLAAKDELRSTDIFANGQWREYVDDGTVVPIPMDALSTEQMAWLAESRMKARFAGGYFLGPTDQSDPVAKFGAPERFTSLLLQRVAATGQVPTITDVHKRLALNDLLHWRADMVILAPQQNYGALRRTMNKLLGISGVGVDDVWLWDVRGLV